MNPNSKGSAILDQPEELKSSLIANGWFSFDVHDYEKEDLETLVLSVGKVLGEPRATRRGNKLIDHLIPAGRDSAKPNSLSARYGLGSFPWHTDGAHWIIPPRFLVFACMHTAPSAGKTLICDGIFFPSLNSRSAKAPVFRVTNGAKSFYTSIRDPDNKYYRYDPGCMTPMDEAAEIIMDETNDSHPAEHVAIEWQQGRVLILDNWQVLHKRMGVVDNQDREILRVTVMDDHNNV